MRLKILALLALLPLLTGQSYYLAAVPEQVSVGDEFTTYVLLDFEGTDPYIAHSVSVQYDYKKLEVVSSKELGVPPFELNLSPGVVSPRTTVGLIGECEAVSFGLAYSVEPFLVCSIRFRAVAPGNAGLAPVFGYRDGLLNPYIQLVDGVGFFGSHVKIKKE